MHIYLAGLDTSSLSSPTNGYKLAAQIHSHALVSFFFYVAGAHKQRLSNSIVPLPKESQDVRQDDQP